MQAEVGKGVNTFDFSQTLSFNRGADQKRIEKFKTVDYFDAAPGTLSGLQSELPMRRPVMQDQG